MGKVLARDRMDFPYLYDMPFEVYSTKKKGLKAGENAGEGGGWGRAFGKWFWTMREGGRPGGVGLCRRYQVRGIGGLGEEEVTQLL